MKRSRKETQREETKDTLERKNVVISFQKKITTLCGFMKNIALSVIVPAYNCEKTLAQTLDSLLGQKSKDLEVVIVNDGSADNTESICQSYCSRYDNIKYFKKSNSGVSDTRNLGIENATGEYVAFLDSDDIWDSAYYDEELNSLLKKGEHDILVFSTCFSDMELNVLEYVKVEDQILVDKKNKAVDTYYHHFSSFIFRKSFLDKNSLRFNNRLRYGEDELFRAQCLYLAHSIFAKDKLSFYYRNNVYSATKINRKQKLYAVQKLEAYYLFKDFFLKQYEKEGTELIIKNSNTVSYFAYAIKHLSEIGYGYKKVKKICNDENISSLYENIGKYYNLYYVEKGILESYIKNPFVFYVKKRLHGIWYYPALDFKHWLVRTFK